MVWGDIATHVEDSRRQKQLEHPRSLCGQPSQRGRLKKKKKKKKQAVSYYCQSYPFIANMTPFNFLT